jgi:hypothetical protein
MRDREQLGAGIDDGAREVEVTSDGVVRDVQPVETPGTAPTSVKPTKLSPHTFGNA